MKLRREMGWYILKRGVFLCVVLLAVAVALMVRAREGGALAARFYGYAGDFYFSGWVALACGLLGSVLAEDLLGYYGE